MKRIILLTICIALLLTGCGQVAVPEADAKPAAAHEETIPAAGAQTVLIETAEEAAEPPAADIPVQTPEPAPGMDTDTAPEQPTEELPLTPATTGDIYSIEEAMRVGNEYAHAQYGATIDTSMTTAESSYYPGTADSVAWLSKHGGQAALNAAVCGNVDATFACLAALDGAEIVSAYARFNCAVHYNVAGDAYIVVVLYG